MYSRSYGAPDAPVTPVSVPGGYDGVAFRETTPPEKEDEACEPASAPVSNIGTLFSGIFGGGKFSMPKFEAEDILLLVAAAFLFFTKDGDKECALLILILLFLG